MARTLKLITAVLVLGIAVGAWALPGALQRRVVETVRARCAERQGLRCSVGAVRLASDGVLLRDVRVQTHDGAGRVQVDRVAVRVQWLRWVLGRPQGVGVRVDGVEVRAQGALQAIVDSVRGPEGVSPRGRRRMHLRRLDVSDVQVAVDVVGRTGLRLRGTVRGLSLHWDSAASARVQWEESRMQDPGGTLSLTRCEVLRRLDLTTARCDGFEGEADLGRVRARGEALRAELGAWSSARTLAPSPSDDADHTDEPQPAPRSRWEAQLRQGRMRLRQGRQILFDLRPATLSAEGHGTHLAQLRAQLGGDVVGEPAVAATVTRPPGSRWRVELDATGLPLDRIVPWVPGVPWHGTERGRFEAQVRVEPTERAGAVEVHGSVRVEEFGLSTSGLAREPVDGLTVEARGHVLVDLERRRVATAGVHAALNGIRFAVSGWAEHDGHHTALDASLHVPLMDCDLPRRALPRVVVGPLLGFGFQGNLGGSAHVAVDTRRLGDTILDWDVVDACRVLHPSAEANTRRFGGPFVQHVLERGGVPRAFITGPGAPTWTSLESINPALLHAVITREDGGFYRHRGFSRDEVRGALVRNLQLGRFAFGASTISMQLVKNVFLAREKTLVRKLQEVALTWWIEQTWDKRSILELYLNVVEFGPGIYGVGPAARFFFGREPSELTLMQSIYLATLLPAPVPRFVLFERGVVPGETLARLRSVARSMAAAGHITSAEAAAAGQETLTFRPARSAVPGVSTMVVGPEVTDEAARQQVERMGVQPSAAPAPGDDNERPVAPDPAPDDEPPG